MIESNEEDGGNEECEEENPFHSGFGAIHSDTDDATDIDSNIKEQTAAAKESSQTHREDYDTKQETANTTGRFIILDIFAIYLGKNRF